MERSVLLAGLRRFLIVFSACAAATAAVSLLVGATTGSRLVRSLAIGYYVAGSLLLIAGFFLGNRGPVRAERNQPLPLFGPRFVRWATAQELDEAINTSAVYVFLGFALILAGVLADSV
ncbi:MAG TPA: hypothetical protein VF002_02050 [Gaiellaceae bacterium]